ncbi:NAD(P)-dependent oxidoreductase [Pelotalea chapellei]|uniref:NAD(P)-dependent oxidoreductase n=1 Tax=Pelotalea chapellei TaxID=44671 RepID=A0ABS5U966_9BACT|nr:NAD(P)-dependent oxidoreductase [Pelotalea chapellei]MBT1072210.1 NAD(P)-dependent oxidoreductase [Pelotalea chapellei]
MKIGFIGLGIMGSAMATNLVKAGYDLTVWNRSGNACRPLAEIGATVAATPRAAAETCDIVISMMADPAAVKAVRDGVDGIISGMSAGKGFIDMSTVDAETSLNSARMTQEKGARYLEAPVAGSRKPAEDAALIIMTAGDRHLYDEALPILGKMGKKILYLGDTGSAARMKLANNLVMAGMLTALCEGLALTAKSGLDVAQLLEVVDSGAMSNPMFRLKGPLITADGEIPAAFPLKHMQKDLRLALRLAEEVGQPLFAAATVNELFKSALAADLGNSDFAAVSRIVHRD